MIGIINVYAFILGGLLFWPSDPSFADTTDAVKAVESFHQSLLESMQAGDRLSYEQRYQILTPVIATAFDSSFITKVVLGRYWGTFEPSEQDRLESLFVQLIISTYAARFDRHHGESFETLEQVPLRKKGRVLVKTQLNRPDRQAVTLDYLMHETDGGWYIIAVIANGVNDLALKRAEYGAVIKEQGLPTLLEKIEKKIKALALPGEA